MLDILDMSKRKTCVNVIIDCFRKHSIYIKYLQLENLHQQHTITHISMYYRYPDKRKKCSKDYTPDRK